MFNIIIIISLSMLLNESSVINLHKNMKNYCEQTSLKLLKLL